jgi:hypothetical protein
MRFQVEGELHLRLLHVWADRAEANTWIEVGWRSVSEAGQPLSLCRHYYIDELAGGKEIVFGLENQGGSAKSCASRQQNSPSTDRAAHADPGQAN